MINGKNRLKKAYQTKFLDGISWHVNYYLILRKTGENFSSISFLAISAKMKTILHHVIVEFIIVFEILTVRPSGRLSVRQRPTIRILSINLIPFNIFL